MRTCPTCGRQYDAPPALSRKDNTTQICPLCGTREALEGVPITDEQKAAILAAVEKGEKENGRL